MNYIGPKIKKGRFTNYRTTVSHEFVYNPSRLGDERGVHMVVDAIPGFSDELVRFGAGKSQGISLTLDLCGEARRRFGGRIGNGAVDGPTAEEAPFDISGEIAWYESFFGFPTDDKNTPWYHGDVEILVFTYGTRYPGVLCLGTDLNIDIFEFDPNGNPVRAQLRMSLARIVSKQRYSTDIWRPAEGGRVAARTGGAYTARALSGIKGGGS